MELAKICKLRRRCKKSKLAANSKFQAALHIRRRDGGLEESYSWCRTEKKWSLKNIVSIDLKNLEKLITPWSHWVILQHMLGKRAHLVGQMHFHLEVCGWLCSCFQWNVCNLPKKWTNWAGEGLSIHIDQGYWLIWDLGLLHCIARQNYWQRLDSSIGTTFVHGARFSYFSSPKNQVPMKWCDFS